MNILLLIILYSFASLAMEDLKVIKLPFTRAYFGFLNPPESLPKYMQEVVREIPELESSTNWRQVDQYLLYEHVFFFLDIDNSSYCDVEVNINNKYNSSGIIYSGALANYNQQNKNQPNYITCKPLVLLKYKNNTFCELSMGTKLHVEGEFGNSFCVKLPDNASAFISKDDVCELSSLQKLSQAEIGMRIISQARLLRGLPFQWGGRSAFLGSGYDCAGLVNIVFATCGIDLPRSAYDQYSYAQALSFDKLQPGDLVFTLEHNYAIHTMIWAGNNLLIEATPVCMSVREALVEEVFGRSFDAIKFGQKFSFEPGEAEIYSIAFGRF